MATQNTHFRLILCLILRGGRVALVSPNLRRDMLPWSVGGVTDLPSDAKLTLATSSAVYSLSVEGSTGLGWGLGLPFADLDLR